MAMAAVILAVTGACSTSDGTESVTEAVASAPFTGRFPGPAVPATAAVQPPAVARGPIDGATLTEALGRAGVRLGPGTGVYAAKVVESGGGVGYREYEAGVGATWTGFWPASSIKLLTAAGALQFIGRMGFTGAATVRFADGFEDQVRHIYDLAIRESDNEAHDRLLQIVGVDWLNNEFLTAANGFPDTVVQRPYSKVDARSSPAMTLTEGSSTTGVPARRTTTNHSCKGRGSGNCSTLLELSESVRRVVLDVELPPADRVELDPSDRSALTRALLRSDGFFEPGVTRALGPAAQVFSKFGWVKGLSCVDAALVEDGAAGERYLLAVVAPDDGGECAMVEILAEKVTAFLRSNPASA